MFSRLKRKLSFLPGSPQPDRGGSVPAEQSESRQLAEIEKARRDIMLACLESWQGQEVSSEGETLLTAVEEGESCEPPAAAQRGPEILPGHHNRYIPQKSPSEALLDKIMFDIVNDDLAKHNEKNVGP